MLWDTYGGVMRRPQGRPTPSGSWRRLPRCVSWWLSRVKRRSSDTSHRSTSYCCSDSQAAMPEGGANHMPEGLISRVWTRVRNWFSANAEQMTLKFFPDDGEPIRPYDGYVRLWLSEGYL